MSSATTATTTSPNGSKLLAATNYDRHICAAIIAARDDWEELLDSIVMPQQRRNVAYVVLQIRQALGLEAVHALDLSRVESEYQ
jgi:hypothetical protein